MVDDGNPFGSQFMANVDQCYYVGRKEGVCQEVDTTVT